MANYITPGVYTENIKGSASIEAVSASVGGFVGVAVRGPLNKAVLVTSWQSFLDNFAVGSSPFLVNSDLAYSVYGFFQNGGTSCYVSRVVGAGATAASHASGDAKFYAKEPGVWGNKLSVFVGENPINNEKLCVSVRYDGEEVEYFPETNYNDPEADDHFVKVLENSKYIYAVGESFAPTTTSDAPLFTGGADGSEVTDADFKKALSCFDVTDVNLICAPGQTSEKMTKAVLDYAENRGNVFAIVDAPKSVDAAGAKNFRGSFSCKNGAMYYPWIKVSDPLSKTGKLRDCPVCGHVMGVYARIIQERGVWKAPAGTETNIRGAIETVRVLSDAEVGMLNSVGVNAVTSKPNYGIVVWGARSLHPDSSMKYVSDILLNVNIKESVTKGTQWAVFEPNNSVLWTRVKTTVEAFLDSLWRAGGLFGDSAEQAYYVKCDEDLNPENVRNEGKLICELGYAVNKPAEFVVIRISHGISN